MDPEPNGNRRSERRDHGFGHLLGADAALAVGPGVEVGGPQALVERRLDCVLEPLRGITHVEAVAQHHRHGEEGCERVGDALAGDVGGRAVHRLEHAGAGVAEAG